MHLLEYTDPPESQLCKKIGFSKSLALRKFVRKCICTCKDIMPSTATICSTATFNLNTAHNRTLSTLTRTVLFSEILSASPPPPAQEAEQPPAAAAEQEEEEDEEHDEGNLPALQVVIVSGGGWGRTHTHNNTLYMKKSACEHRPRRALATSTFAPSARPFVSVVGPLQKWSHHGRDWAGGRCGCGLGRCPSGPMFAYLFPEIVSQMACKWNEYSWVVVYTQLICECVIMFHMEFRTISQLRCA